MAVNPISSGPPHVRPMGVHRTCGEPDEIKKNAHPKNITALFVIRRGDGRLRGVPPVVHQHAQHPDVVQRDRGGRQHVLKRRQLQQHWLPGQRRRHDVQDGRELASGHTCTHTLAASTCPCPACMPSKRGWGVYTSVALPRARTEGPRTVRVERATRAAQRSDRDRFGRHTITKRYKRGKPFMTPRPWAPGLGRYSTLKRLTPRPLTGPRTVQGRTAQGRTGGARSAETPGAISLRCPAATARGCGKASLAWPFRKSTTIGSRPNAGGAGIARS